ncbi:MAG: hypothetical protein ACR2PM_14585 [Hyphomicrobiales bacterium]
MTNNLHQTLKSAAIIALVTALTGCASSQQYLDRSDTITMGIGDAVAHNKAIHIINPRPRHAYRTHIHHSGERMSHAMDNYNAGPASTQSSSAADTNGQVEGDDAATTE